MSAAKVISSSTNSANLKKLNLSEAVKLVELAMQKYPDFTLDVSRAVSAAESRAKLESIAKFYDDIAEKFWEELHREDEWSHHEKQFGGTDERLLQDLVNEVTESVNENSANEVFETAFKCFLCLAGHLTEVQETTDDDDPFPQDVSRTIKEVRSAMDDMGLLWIKKGGKICKATLERVLKLAGEDDYEDFDNFRWDLLETVQYEEQEEEDAICELQVEPKSKRIRVE